MLRWLIVASVALCVGAFNSQGHKVVTEIAFNNMTNPYRELLLQKLAPFDLYTASTFADDIKHKNGSF